MSAFPFLGRKKGQPPKLEDVSSGGALRRLGRRLPPIVVGGVPNFPYLFRDSVKCVENVARGFVEVNEVQVGIRGAPRVTSHCLQTGYQLTKEGKAFCEFFVERKLKGEAYLEFSPGKFAAV